MNKKMIESLIKACENNPWLSDSYYNYEDYNYAFKEIESTEKLIDIFEHGNWAIRSGFTIEMEDRAYAFVQQVNGGDEYLALVHDDEDWVPFESISFESILENYGKEYTKDYIENSIVEVAENTINRNGMTM